MQPQMYILFLNGNVLHININCADPGGVGVRSLGCWDCGVESQWGHGYLCRVSDVCCLAGLIPRPEESYRVYALLCVYVIKCDQTEQQLCTYNVLVEEIGLGRKEGRKERKKEY